MGDVTPVDRLPLASPDPWQARMAQLRALMPEVFTEGQLDLAKLAAWLKAQPSDEPERYRFTWAGKREAMQHVRVPSTATLLPAPAESVRFDETENVVIAGDNLEVLKLLQKAYYGKVKLIYIDPPYNTGQDFIYADDFRDGLRQYLRYTGQVADDGTRLTTHVDKAGRLHSRWLSMMYPRLFLARNLLAEDGFICVSIGDEEVHHLRLLMNEVFGEENHVNTLAVRRFDKNLSLQFVERGLPSLAVGFEYVLVYRRSPRAMLNPVYREASEARKTSGYWKGFWNAADRPTMRYELLGVTPTSGQWKWKREVAEEAVRNYEEYLAHYAAQMSLEAYWEQTGRTKRFIRRNPNGQGMNQGVEHWVPPSSGVLRTSNWTDILASESLHDLGIPFDNPKNRALIKTLIAMTCDTGDLVLDFFAGSGTTGHAVMEVNAEQGTSHRFLLVQLPERIGGHDPDTAATAAADGAAEDIFTLMCGRLRAAGSRIAAGDAGAAVDTGFKVFRLAPSNFRVWDGAAEDAAALAVQVRLFADHVLPGRSDLDILYEVMLKAGLPLTAPVAKLSLCGGRAYMVANGALCVCLADEVSAADVEAIAALRPARVVALDAAFHGRDERKLNAKLRLEAHGIAFQTV
ncbi:adenine methyltransferase [Alicyclobacillus cellulosilyticus]|uniref:Adenine methyltransferase n=1 Tax=Alicyclobacillus cellulosilyticus TaxID=1003997 RepID=A0A917KE24_9BACL|nr:site-specific DNA-methyltransferase [Alicyclobacillus cellulosilyticus]GGJ10806.1 adenine methyltransferase [Alicyclobacillus cellulosilyticus]